MLLTGIDLTVGWRVALSKKRWGHWYRTPSTLFSLQLMQNHLYISEPLHINRSANRREFELNDHLDDLENRSPWSYLRILNVPEECEDKRTPTHLGLHYWENLWALRISHLHPSWIEQIALSVPNLQQVNYWGCLFCACTDTVSGTLSWGGPDTRSSTRSTLSRVYHNLSPFYTKTGCVQAC